MPWKKRSLKDSKLYLILDTQVNAYDELLDILRKTMNHGVDIVQLRDKHGSDNGILEFSRKAIKILKGTIPYIVNDRIDLALASGADGVHLGQEDVPIPIARKMLGRQAIIGASCQTLAQARQSERNRVDYIGFGSVFSTLTKPDRHPMDLKLLQRVVSTIKIPVYAIGGMTTKNASMVADLGVDHIAVCRAICKAQNIRKATSDFKKVFAER